MALHITDVLEYGGTAEDLVWKSDIVNFNNNSKVVVRPSQEAIYISGGVMSDTMESGTHILKSKNLPGFRKIQGFLSGGKTATTGEVYFFNMAVARPISWGTRESVEMMDPVYHVPIRVGAGGTMHVRIGNSRKLLEKMVGMQESFTRGKMDGFFRGVLAGNIGNHLSNVLSASNLSCMEFSRETKRLADGLKSILAEEFRDYGLILEKFYIDRIPVNDDDIEKIRKILKENTEERLQDRMKNERDHENVLSRGTIDQLKAQNEAKVRQIQADTAAYETIVSGRASNTLKAEEGQVQAATNAALGITEKEKMAFKVVENIAANTDAATGEIFLSGGIFPEMGGKIPGNSGVNAAAAVDGMKAILKNDGAAQLAEEKRNQEYKRARNLLTEDYNEGVLTREEYMQELSRLREKYAR
ncbi:MAG: SPFH domain-containing protein [Eubacteriales bacterium]|nr:SPFH domain-containing protein [Eubacteriales bacterium]